MFGERADQRMSVKWRCTSMNHSNVTYVSTAKLYCLGTTQDAQAADSL